MARRCTLFFVAICLGCNHSSTTRKPDSSINAIITSNANYNATTILNTSLPATPTTNSQVQNDYVAQTTLNAGFATLPNTNLQLYVPVSESDIERIKITCDLSDLETEKLNKVADDIPWFDHNIKACLANKYQQDASSAPKLDPDDCKQIARLLRSHSIARSEPITMCGRESETAKVVCAYVGVFGKESKFFLVKSAKVDWRVLLYEGAPSH